MIITRPCHRDANAIGAQSESAQSGEGAFPDVAISLKVVEIASIGRNKSLVSHANAIGAQSESAQSDDIKK